MEALDLTLAPPRGPRERLLGLAFLPRTIDKMRASLPGGNLAGYLVDFPRGLSAYMLKRVGVDLAAMQRKVAEAEDEADVLAWFADHADLSDVDGLNAKLEALGMSRLPEDERAMVYRAHPGLDQRSDLTAFFDIFEFDDARHPARAAQPSTGR
ncbi:MAG: DUF5069 domain-containing protein [Candidatus Eremiobacteraeota bacterium]|nr:DUF5069 domain-containing protein [Candidatus Eremiobacteraeota bacterium]